MSAPAKVKKADLARHWKVSPSYVSKLIRTKGMPEFETLAAADEWRSIYAPTKPALEVARTSPAPHEKLPPTGENSPTPPLPSPQVHQPTSLEGLSQKDLDAFCVIEGTFEETMIRRARRNALIAGAMCERSVALGLVSHVAVWGDRFNDQAETARKLTASYLDLQEKANVLVPIDTVMDVMGTELQQVRTVLQKFGGPLSVKLFPNDPSAAASAKALIDAEVDNQVFRQIDHVEKLSLEVVRAS